MKTNPIGLALWLLALLTAAVYAVLLWLGPNYALTVPQNERPLLTVLTLYGVACGLYFAALHFSVRRPSTSGLGWWIFGTSLLMRCLLLPTPPFQEIDIYRYLWDGTVVCEGVDPYAYTPEQVANWLETDQAPGNATLHQLVQRARSEPALQEIVETIHYAHLPSPYPPVSQAVFAAAAATASHEWSATERLTWLKGFLTLFDMATLLLVMQLLRRTGRPLGWALVYGWCPLVLKEVAGSGHLDSIATFFTIAAAVAAVEAFVGKANPSRGMGWGLLAAVLLGLGVGAKLYPIVLAPLLAAALWRRMGFRSMAIGAVAFIVTVAIGLSPMLWPRSGEVAAVPPNTQSFPPLPGTLPTTKTANPSKTAGIATFLQKWEMNDLLFMIAYENLRWHGDENLSQNLPGSVQRSRKIEVQGWGTFSTSSSQRAWFDVTPNDWSTSFQEDDRAAFFTARVATLVAFLAIVVGLIWQNAWPTGKEPIDPSLWLRAAFLTLAWFWLLAPTQNPWYWCWAVPLLPFVRSRAWLAISAACFAYYLRFWLQEHFPAPGVAGTPYDGEYFFYYVVPWLEWGILLTWLALRLQLFLVFKLPC